MHQLVFVNGPETPESDSNTAAIDGIIAGFTIGVVITIWIALAITTGLLIYNYVCYSYNIQLQICI